jgi:non-specific serine/threonine protein kinase/serine/threonine-protein kinase
VTRIPAPDRWRLIAPLLEEALDLPPHRRGAFLDQVCGGDPGLRAEIEDLLSADSEAGSFLGAPVELSAVALPPGEIQDPAPDSVLDSPVDSPQLAGATIGPYRVVREIGRGGMGVVYEAEQQRPRRPVALKVILGGRHVDATAVRMFQRETDSLARLKHPGIAAIYESGSTDEGQHFFAMELVPGRTLSDYLEQTGAPASRQDVRCRLALFRKIGAAVAYAHQRGVIHRDLKPSNILVLEPQGGAVSRGGGAGMPGSRDAADGVPDIKILDFGLARITDPEAEAATAVTAIGRIQGTLPYMSPEQVRGRRDEVDVRTDVYALGVILYRMLTGRLPYDLEGAEFPEAARIVCEQAPRPLRTAAGARLKFDHDLTVIVQKALEKEPARRYQSVAALDEDVARYLGGQPILARPPSAAYQIRKLVARHKVPFAAAGAIVILFLGFAIVATLQARRIAAERDRANREAKTAQRVSDFMTDLFKVSDPNEARGNAITAREILDKGVEKIEKELADEPEVQARLMLAMGRVYSNLGLFREAGPILEQAVETRRRLLGEENLDTLAAMNSLAFQYAEAGRTSEAEKLYARVLEVRRRLQGEDHPDTLVTMAGLAEVYRRQGRYAEGEKLAIQVLEARRRVLGEDHWLTLSSMGNLANSYYLQRRYADAEALYLPAVEKSRRVLGDDHPTTIVTMENLARIYGHQGRFAEAEKLLREALDRLRRVVGEDHPYTLEAMNQLGVLFDVQGRQADAEPLYREALERRRRVLGEDHYDTLVSMMNVANMLAVRGRHADAEALLREALDRVRRVLGENHPLAAGTLYNLGCLAARRGDRSGALDWLGQAVTHGYSRPDTMTKDSDLQRLRGDPAFEALVARARENSGK